MQHKIEQAADAVERELADLRAKLAVAVEVIKALRAEWYLRDLQASDFEDALEQIKRGE